MLKNYDIVLVDGSSYLFRAYHALPPLENSEGIPTGAIYGVLNMIQKLQKDYAKAKIIVVFDPKGGTFRHEMYPEYKSDRGAMPDDLAIQIPILHEIIRAQGLPLLIAPGYEADDVIASLVKLGGDKRILISTLDKDLAQLVTDKVHLINTMHNKLLDPEGVMAKFGVRPDQIRDYLSLIGDRSDCIPGIPGVGPKTASKWLGLYENLEGIKQNQQEIGGKVGETLRREILQLDLSSQLVELVDSLSLAESIDEIIGSEEDTELLKARYLSLGFKRWYMDLSKPAEVAFSLVKNRSAVPRILKMINAAKEVTITIYSSEEGIDAPLEALVLFVKEQTFVLTQEKLDLIAILQDITPSLADKQLNIFDAKKWVNLCEINAIPQLSQLFDPMLAAYVLDSQLTPTIEAMSGRYVAEASFADKKTLIPYLVSCVQNTQKLAEQVKQILVDTTVEQSLYQDVEMPLMRLLAKMEREGVMVNREALKEYAQQLKTALQEIEEDAHALVGRSFNLASPKQLREVLFAELKLPVIEKTPGGDPSTAESTLTALSDKHALIPMLLKHRSLSKILSTYAESLYHQTDDNGRVHGRFNQAVTVTGRLSSANPNLQNIPIRNEAGRKIRRCFIPKPGYQLVSADYSQIELRIMAHYSKDTGLIDAFAHDQDIHTATAARVANIPLDEVTDEQRRQAKAVNFGLIYGMSAFGLSKQLGVERGEAKAIIDRYFETYPGIYQYMEDIRSLAEKEGFVNTILGRKIMVSGAKSNNSIEKQAAMRAAINAPMQGSASELIKLAMLEVDKTMQQYDYQMTIQVHDELIFEVREDQVDAFQAELSQIMENIYTLGVALKVNVSSGRNWEEAH